MQSVLDGSGSIAHRLVILTASEYHQALYGMLVNVVGRSGRALTRALSRGNRPPIQLQSMMGRVSCGPRPVDALLARLLGVGLSKGPEVVKGMNAGHAFDRCIRHFGPKTLKRKALTEWLRVDPRHPLE
jgi:hypothetical protein